ncbi:hypothetical protein HZF05_18845 [Sphingomonas sp. CGMCC 1.13654]|uniref:Uncharacterized protein n=1 Tax=Sphingomonas chungangi TaxID=2683589 RepID=A0A838LBQ6_9SPHN|nr:hypothetical protein [Sphingomonas chungangi]MBA2936145.1 hypothetical protein [Sphingomonas chungangi]MVW55531.1 hypothetical protein [Sphingomonas chungangi]
MFQASPTLTEPSLSAALIRRRKPLLLAPPACQVTMPVEVVEQAEPRWPTWREDLRFFAGCYAAGLIFFIIMLS